MNGPSLSLCYMIGIACTEVNICGSVDNEDDGLVVVGTYCVCKSSRFPYIFTL